MKGTEKQIAWAEGIKTAAINNINHNIDLSMARYEEYDHHPNYLATAEAFRVMAAVLAKVFAEHDDAEYIIDRRDMLAFASLCRTVDKWADLILSGKKTAAEIAAQNGIKDYRA